MCWIGRPALWGLAYDGELGVRLALDILEEEFRACMALSGLSSVEQIKLEGPKLLRRVDQTNWRSPGRKNASAFRRTPRL